MPVVNRRISRVGTNLQEGCAQAIAQWEGLEEPAEIEDAVNDFLPKDEPLRSEAMETLAKARAPRVAATDALRRPSRAATVWPARGRTFAHAPLCLRVCVRLRC